MKVTQDSLEKENVPRNLRRSNGARISLHRKINTSGEGSIYTTEEVSFLAKIYHTPSLEKAHKLQKMLSTPSFDPTLSQGHTSIAWPTDLLLNQQGAVQGFLMPKIRGGHPLTYVYNPKLRRQKTPAFNWYYLHTTALNVAWILKALHEKNFIVGDLKPENFLVNAQALVTILDTDSFQFFDNENEFLFLSPVGSEGLTPPELIGKNLSLEPRTELHDRFGLAVLIYFLLFGVHPFSGIWRGEGETPSLDMRVFQGLSHFSSPLIQESGLTPSLSILPSFLQQAFKRAFDKGHSVPHERPSSKEWTFLLKDALSLLETCPAQRSHFYYHEQGPCPWCLHLLHKNVDLFPNLSLKDKNDAFLTSKEFESFLKKGDLLNARKLLNLLKTSCDPALLKNYEKDLLEAEELMHSFSFFEKILQKGPDADRELLDFWKTFPLKNHPLTERPLPLFKEDSVKNKVAQSQRRQVVLKEINILFEKAEENSTSPLTFFDDFLRLWDKSLFENHSQFSFMNALISEAHQALKSYNLLKAAILNERVKEALLLWQPFFENRLKRDGLFEPFYGICERFFQSFKNLISLETHFKEKEEGRMIYADFSPLPSALSSLNTHLQQGMILSFSENFSLPFFVSQKKVERLGGRVFLPFSSQQTNAASPLYTKPALMLGKIVFIFDAPLEVSSLPSPHEIFIKTSLKNPSFFNRKNSFSFRIEFLSRTSLHLPALTLKAGVSKIPLASDTPPDIFILGEIPPFFLEAHTLWTQEISLPQDIPENLIKKFVLSLEPLGNLNEPLFFNM